MKIKEVMSSNPVCCLPSDNAQRVAQIMCEENVGSIPVVTDPESRKLVGMITGDVGRYDFGSVGRTSIERYRAAPKNS